jgi:hypothetical protein
MQVPNCFGYPSVFVDVSENLIMADDVTMPSNPPVALVKKEKLEKALLDMNVSQWSHEEEPSKRGCALKSIIQHGIVDYLLTHMP